MKKLSCFGDMCPIPLLKLKQALDEGADEVMLVVDHSCVLESVRDYLAPRPYTFEADEVINGVWEITVSRIPPRRAP